MADLLSAGKIRAELGENQNAKASANKGPQKYALGFAQVVRVDHKKLQVDILLLTGETVLKRAVPISWPGAGRRHFFGAMPEPGDMCIVGFGPGESGLRRAPFIMSWVVPGPTTGYDWIPTQPFSTEELGLTPKLAEQLRGVASRYRHKLRTMEPGNVVASSGQGADLILDESATLANRRGNEVRLRDQDQALVVRSLQQFHAGAGFRFYTGMVQRDATLLPTQMFTSILDWSAPRQMTEEGVPAVPVPSSTVTAGLSYLNPDPVFDREPGDDSPLSEMSFSAEIDPHDFLKRGLFIDSLGYARANPTPDAVYGGKPIFRVSTDGSNGALSTDASVFTEHRVEVSHTTDGTLPVTEQTDGLDADRLPGGSPEDTDPNGVSEAVPFIQSVLGTVVGNDPYTTKGNALYGIPLRPVVFDGQERSPGLVSGLGTPIEQHAATLFSVRPPLTPNASPTFWSVDKRGVLYASLAGPASNWSAEVAFSSGLRIGSGVGPGGQSIQADLDGSLAVNAKGDNATNWGINLAAPQGAVRLFAGESTTEGGIASRSAPSGEGESNLPGLSLEAATNVLVKAGKTLTLSATRLDLSNVQELNINGNASLNFQSGDGISQSSNTFQQAVMGKSEYTFSGPKGSNPTNGAMREVQFIANPATGFPGGTADKYDLLYGDKVETYTAGNHRSTIAVGNRVYTIGTGTWSATVAPSSLTISQAGINATGPQVAVVASGAASITASSTLSLTGATMAITTGALTINSLAGLHSIAPQIPGGILTDGCLNPLTGTPFSVTGTLGIQTLRVN